MNLGNLHLPAPTTTALLVLKLTSRGEPIWGRSIPTGALSSPAVASTAAGNLVVGGKFFGGSLQVGTETFANAGDSDSFVILLDGATGDPRWWKMFATAGEERLGGIAVGTDASAKEAIYVHGQVAQDVTVDGRILAQGGFLIRYDTDGILQWANSFPRLDVEYNNALALDPQRGPVIAGIGSVDDQVSPSGAVIAAFDPEGQLRFARSLRSQFIAHHHDLAVAPSGDIYVASYARSRATVIDGRVISNSDSGENLYMLRLTPEGRYAYSTVIAGETFAIPSHVITDAAGNAYMLGECGGKTAVQPEITCDEYHGNVLVSYDVNNETRWSTSFEPAFAEAMAIAPGNHLIVAGQALADQVRIGGAPLASQPLFIASLGAGPARLPSPLPAAPAISKVTLEGASSFDLQIRQGGTATLVIDGAGLDHVTSAWLGDIDIHIPPNAGTADQLRLPVTIPHGQAAGPLTLMLGNAGGRTFADRVVTVTPIVAGATAGLDGRGTFNSPMSLCKAQDYGNIAYGDLLYILNGRHGCGVYPPRGATARGQSMTDTIVTGGGASEDGFDPSVIENLTVEANAFSAIEVFFGGELTLVDITVRNRSGSGIYIDGGATATVTRYRYDSSVGTALIVANGRVRATDVTASNAYRGVILSNGTLDLINADLSSDESAIHAGDQNTTGGTRKLTIAGSKLRSTRVAVTEALTDVTITDSVLERGTANPGRAATGIQLFGGTLTLARSSVRGWDMIGIDAERAPASPWNSTILHVSLDQVDVEARGTGFDFSSAAFGSDLVVRRSHIVGQGGGLIVADGFAAVDLGTTASPGDNSIDNLSGPALEDFRTTAGEPVNAHGTALNGLGFDGDVLGPVSLPGTYTISGPNIIRF